MSAPKAEPQVNQQSSTTAPWSEQQPFLTKGFAEAEKLYNQGPQTMYGGALTAGPDAATTASMNATEARATNGNPLLGQAQGEASKILSGSYLNPNSNPGFQSVLDTTRANTLPGIDSRFMGAGRSGSGLHGRAVGEGLGSAIGALTYGNYNDERNRMTGAMSAAPTLAAADYMDPSMLGQVGAQREGYAQQGINEQIARYDFNQNAPQDLLTRFMGNIGGNYGSQNSSTSTQYMQQQNPWMQALGIGLGGLGTAGKLGWQPFG